MHPTLALLHLDRVSIRMHPIDIVASLHLGHLRLREVEVDGSRDYWAGAGVFRHLVGGVHWRLEDVRR